MKSVEESIQALSAAVLAKADAEAEEILRNARAEADGMRQQAQEEANALQQRILAEAQAEAARIRGQAAASAELEARTQLLARRDLLLKKVFDAAKQRLSSTQEWGDYGQIIPRLVREAVTHLGADPVHIRTDKRAAELLTDDVLASLGSELGVQLQRGTPLEKRTGVIAVTADGHRQYDNTLEAQLGRQLDALRSPVYRILMGETQ